MPSRKRQARRRHWWAATRCPFNSSQYGSRLPDRAKTDFTVAALTMFHVKHCDAAIAIPQPSIRKTPMVEGFWSQRSLVKHS
jgi:hypothetical protein